MLEANASDAMNGITHKFVNFARTKYRESTLFYCLRKVLDYFAHIARKEGNNLEQVMVKGKLTANDVIQLGGLN